MQKIKITLPALVLACSGVAIISMSFRDTGTAKTPVILQVQPDTPKNNCLHLDIDLNEINKALDEVNIELKEINWDKISKEIDLSLNSIDVDKITKEVDESLRQINWDKIKNDIDTSVKNIDLDKIKIEIKNATDKLKEK